MASSGQESNHGIGPIPTGVNPFAYFIKMAEERFASGLSGATPILLAILLVFHSLIVIFCSFILIMSFTSGSKDRWFVRRIYIKDRNDQILYKNPLYFLNSGLLMNISQLLCSTVAAAYMWVQIRASWSAEYAIHAQIIPCFGLIYIFETLTYWSMTHCFLVTIYFSRGFNRDSSSGISRWISSPLAINLFFIGFPVLVTVITFILMTWTSVEYNHFTHKLVKLAQFLKQGSSDWEDLHNKFQSDEVKSRIAAQMAEVMTDLETIHLDLFSIIEKFLNAFRVTQAVLLALVCIGCLVFVRMFFLLIGKYRRPHRQSSHTKAGTDWCPSWLKRENFGDMAGQSDDTSMTNMSVVLPNRQFFYLLLRAFGVFLSMITQIAVLFLGVWKARDIMSHPSWRGVTTWLLALSSVWSAAPIAWQCWKLYEDDSQTRSCSDNENIDFSSGVIHPDSSANDYSPEDTKFDIQLPTLDTVSKLPSFSCRGINSDAFLNDEDKTRFDIDELPYLGHKSKY